MAEDIGAKIGQVIWHAIARFVSVICVGLIIVAVAWSIYVSFVRPHTKPNPTQTVNQEAAKIENNEYYYPERRGLIDLKLGFVKISLFEKETYKKIKEIKQSGNITK